MIFSFIDYFFTKKRKEEQQTMSNATSPAFVVNRVGVAKAVSGLDMAIGLTKDAAPSRSLSKAAMHNMPLNKDYHLCGGKYIARGVRLIKPKEELMPVDVVYNGYLAGANAIRLRKGEGNNKSWENVQNMDMVKTSDGYHVASILIKKPVNPTKTTHNMHLAFYTDSNDGEENWDNNKGQNFSFEIPIMAGQTTAQGSTQNNNQNPQASGNKSSNIINNLLGISPKKHGSK